MNKQSYNSVTDNVHSYILHAYATIYIACVYRYILHVYITTYYIHMSLYSHSLTYVKVAFCGILHKLNFTQVRISLN